MKIIRGGKRLYVYLIRHGRIKWENNFFDNSIVSAYIAFENFYRLYNVIAMIESPQYLITCLSSLSHSGHCL